MTDLNIQNRTLAIMDNMRFLRSLNNACIDLIAIDPPFAANETFTGRPKPPITDAEIAEEKALAQKHGGQTRPRAERPLCGTSGRGTQTSIRIGSVGWRMITPQCLRSSRQ